MIQRERDFHRNIAKFRHHYCELFDGQRSAIDSSRNVKVVPEVAARMRGRNTECSAPEQFMTPATVEIRTRL